MKPKIFIGSSVEGLNVAYAIQQNLTQDAEATVWDQGVFELSKTTIESLNQVLDTVDFGIFVFSPDDVTIMRGTTSTAIRDNVLFELGLFIGKLGRDRVFFIIPDNSILHIPTDLVGVTPGKYNPTREDKSIQAATGAACNQVRIQIKKLGTIRPDIDIEEADKSSVEHNDKKNEWFFHFISKDYITAKAELQKEIAKNKSDDNCTDNEAWLSFINFKINDAIGSHELCNLAKHNIKNLSIQIIVPQMLTWIDYNDKAIALIETALIEYPLNSKLNVILAECHQKNGDTNKAIEILQENSSEHNPEIAIALSEIHIKNSSFDNAFSVLHAAYERFPRNELLMYKYARLLTENNRHKESLYLLDILTINHPTNHTYWGYLSNASIMLELNDSAMIASEKAEEISNSKEAWILHNIGNIYNNRGFFTKAISSLSKGLEIEPASQYAHERLSKAIKSKEDEKVKFNEFCQEGRKLIRNFQLSKSQ